MLLMSYPLYAITQILTRPCTVVSDYLRELRVNCQLESNIVMIITISADVSVNQALN